MTVEMSEITTLQFIALVGGINFTGLSKFLRILFSMPSKKGYDLFYSSDRRNYRKHRTNWARSVRSSGLNMMVGYVLRVFFVLAAAYLVVFHFRIDLNESAKWCVVGL